jgi:chromate transport protein ChrA
MVSLGIRIVHVLQANTTNAFKKRWIHQNRFAEILPIAALAPRDHIVDRR